MNQLSEVTAKEKLALLNKEIDILDRERDDLLYKYRLMQDKVRRMKKRMLSRLLVAGVCLIIIRIIRIQLGRGSWMSSPPTWTEVYLIPLIADPRLLFFLFLIFSLYAIVLGLKYYAMFAKTEHSVMPIKIAGIMNIKNYNMELVSAETKIRKYDQELQRLKSETEQLFFDTVHQPPF